MSPRFVLAILLAWTGCSGPVGLEIQLQADVELEGWVVVVAAGSEAARVVSCPSGIDGPLTCTAQGAHFDGAEGPLQVTVKAHPFEQRSEIVDAATLPQEEGTATWSVPLVQLGPWEQTEDYATGFDSDDWDGFLSRSVPADTELGPTHLIKFYLADLQGSPRVYFQDTLRHPLHYDFARDVLSVPGTTTDFWLNTYRGEDRAAMAGTLVLYDAVQMSGSSGEGSVEAPIAVTFFPADNLSPALALRALTLLEDRLGFVPFIGGGPHRVHYLPAGTDAEEQIAADHDAFDRRDAAWLRRIDLWGNTELQILNEGEAYGTLRRLSPEELQTTVVSMQDVVILTRLPNELPLVGGTISEEFQTPLAHVNLTAMARGTPNIAWLHAAEDPAVSVLIGTLVHFVVSGGTFTLEAADLVDAQAFWANHHPDPVELSADLEADGLPGFEEIGFDDAGSVGVKAANLAELRNLLGPLAPDGFAVPFRHSASFANDTAWTADLCDGASEDCEAEGRSAELCGAARDLCLGLGPALTLRGYVDALLADPGFQSNSALREALLDGLRWGMRHSSVGATFAEELDNRVLERFGPARVRLRSSTNAEDLADFSGAGLYDSYAAEVADPQDLPSQDVRKVWASVWNWRAFEERAWWGIDPETVHMGVAVSTAFADEQANGVLITQNVADPSVAGMYVNVQAGDALVTNPEDGSIPEIFSILPGSSAGQVQIARLSWSSLSPGVPLLTDEDIGALYAAAAEVQEHFAPLYGQDVEELALDMEFKFAGPERALVIKQVRPFAGY